MRRRKSQNLLQLATALEEEWNNIPGHVIQRYVSSMRRNCVEVLKASPYPLFFNTCTRVLCLSSFLEYLRMISFVHVL